MKKFFNLKDAYNVYRINSFSPIEIKEYLEIVHAFLSFIIDKLLNTGEINLPERMGKVSIVGHKLKPKVEDGVIRGLAVDWKETNLLWKQDPIAKKEKKLIFLFNEDTNRIMYRVHWYRARVLASNKALYDLILTRTNKRRISKLIKEGKEYLIKN